MELGCPLCHPGRGQATFLSCLDVLWGSRACGTGFLVSVSSGIDSSVTGTCMSWQSLIIQNSGTDQGIVSSLLSAPAADNAAFDTCSSCCPVQTQSLLWEQAPFLWESCFVGLQHHNQRVRENFLLNDPCLVYMDFGAIPFHRSHSFQGSVLHLLLYDSFLYQILSVIPYWSSACPVNSYGHLISFFLMIFTFAISDLLIPLFLNIFRFRYCQHFPFTLHFWTCRI